MAGAPGIGRSLEGRRAFASSTVLAAALEKTCEENPAACVLRFALPGLPDEPVLDEYLEGAK